VEDIKMSLTGTGSESVDWIQVAPYRAQW